MPFPASGGGAYMRFTPKIIRFQLHGCTNRPFFHIVVMEVSNLFRNSDRNCDESGLSLMQQERIRAHI
jgi:hypothetical protein